jgi:hypothetical protein
MIELKGITYAELCERYKEPDERKEHQVSGIRISFQVSMDIRIQSVHFFYKSERMIKKYHIPPPHDRRDELYWVIIPRKRSKQLEREAYQIRDDFYKNKTASELVAIASMN